MTTALLSTTTASPGTRTPSAPSATPAGWLMTMEDVSTEPLEDQEDQEEAQPAHRTLTARPQTMGSALSATTGSG